MGEPLLFLLSSPFDRWQLARTQHQKEHVAGLTFLIDKAKGGSSSAYESVKGLPLGMIQVWSTLNRTLCPRNQSTHLLSKDQILGWSKRPEWTQEEKLGSTAVFECLIEDPFPAPLMRTGNFSMA